MRIALASDHAGFDLKASLKEVCVELGHEPVDLGVDSPERVDYPDYGRALAQAVAGGEVDCGVAVCGTGIGISIACNRVPGVRAALCHDMTTAAMSRRHNDANVLALGARIVGPQVARDCLETFLANPFDGGRHAGRVAKLG
ncbi:MAG: ribose 5-phosphate isomerase B [Geminicoccaceae bacterium]